MKLRYKISIFGIAVIGILATAFIFRYELLQAYGSGKILNNLSLSGTPTHGEKLMIYFDDGKGYAYPNLKFHITFLTPEGCKQYQLDATYNDDKQRYYATSDVPKNAYQLYAYVVDAPVNGFILGEKCEGKGEFDTHNHLIREMNNNIPADKRQKIFKEDEMKFPELYERYIAKWSHQMKPSVRRELAQLEKINREKLNPISKISLDLAVLNAYFTAYDHKNIQKAIARLDHDLSSDPACKAYFSQVSSDFADYFFFDTRFKCKLYNKKTKKHEEVNLIEDLLNVAIKHDIKGVYYEYATRMIKDEIMSLDEKFANKLIKHIAKAMINDLEKNNFQDNFYMDINIFDNTTKMLTLLNAKKYNKDIQKLNALSSTFLTNLKAKRVSQDTTDYFRSPELNFVDFANTKK